MHKPLTSDDPTPTVCLAMIVKNEGPRMPRLLDTLTDLIDEVVISDTGSTDDTIEATRAKCKEMGWRCIVDQTPFKDFGFNRSRSIDVAVKKSKCDFILFLDADMKIAKGPLFSKRRLLDNNIDVLSFMQKGCGLEYYNMRMMRRTLKNLRCVGVTHEHYAHDGEGATTSNVPAEIIFIDDIGDGGAKADKFERDYRLLTQGLVEEPTNVRYMFYLAETCRHNGKPKESIKMYKKRVKAGGWDEEIYRSLYGISMCYVALDMGDKADMYAMRAFLFRPSRVESIYMICKWHRERGENFKAYSFYQLGSRVARPKGDVLFVETTPYEWGWDYEFAILAYYVERESANRQLTNLKNPLGSMTCLRKIISSLGSAANRGSVLPGWAYDSMTDNVKHYIDLLPSSFPRTDMLPNIVPTMVSSTPGVLSLKGKEVGPGLFRHARQVDYKIVKENGSYVMRPDGCVGSSCSIQAGEGAAWRELRIDNTGITMFHNTLIKGVEDIRFFNLAPSTAPLSSNMCDDAMTTRIPEDSAEADYTRVYGLGTSVELSGDGKSQMILLEVDINRSVAFPIRRMPRVFDCEKNHAPICGTDLCVHTWGPRLKIYDMVKSTPDKIEWVHDYREAEVPGWFCKLRGSSTGIAWPSVGSPREYWFVCHTVFFETPRRYVHNVVRLDARTFRPVGFTVPFSFDDYKIEFVAGIAFDDNDRTLVVGYSVFDSSSREIRIPVPWLIQNTMITVSAMTAG